MNSVYRSLQADCGAYSLRVCAFVTLTARTGPCRMRARRRGLAGLSDEALPGSTPGWPPGALQPCVICASRAPGLLGVRAAVGLGEGVAPSAATDMVARVIAPEERSRAISFIFGGLHVGSLLGLLVAPVLIDRFGWQTVRARRAPSWTIPACTLHMLRAADHARTCLRCTHEPRGVRWACLCCGAKAGCHRRVGHGLGGSSAVSAAQRRVVQPLKTPLAVR